MLSISVRALDYLTADGKLPTKTIGGRRLIAASALRKFAETGSQPQIAPLPKAA
jgi:hypothetical protein